MTHQERSAGIIVYRRPTGPLGAEQFLLLDYGRYWDFPKGHLKKGEDDESAARRELAEETGLREADLVPGFAHEIAYFFRVKNKLVRKTVLFFLGRVESDRVRISSEHVGFVWLPFEAAIDRLGYATAKEALRAARDYLAAHPQ